MTAHDHVPSVGHLATGLQQQNGLAGRHRRVALACTVFFLTMFGAAFAAVPLYDWFCRVTGFGGTTQVAEAAPPTVLDRTMEIRFDANVTPGLSWRFEPVEPVQRVRIGEPALARYRVTNTGTAPATGIASYNVTPSAAGLYFHKMQCFCFTEQTLAPGETQEFTVSYFVDPDLDRDRAHAGTRSITLSYTFFRSREPRPLAQTARSAALP